MEVNESMPRFESVGDVTSEQNNNKTCMLINSRIEDISS